MCNLQLFISHFPVTSLASNSGRMILLASQFNVFVSTSFWERFLKLCLFFHCVSAFIWSVSAWFLVLFFDCNTCFLVPVLLSYGIFQPTVIKSFRSSILTLTHVIVYTTFLPAWTFPCTGLPVQLPAWHLTWMSDRHFKLHLSQTELLIFLPANWLLLTVLHLR